MFRARTLVTLIVVLLIFLLYFVKPEMLYFLFRSLFYLLSMVAGKLDNRYLAGGLHAMAAGDADGSTLLSIILPAVYYFVLPFVSTLRRRPEEEELKEAHIVRVTQEARKERLSNRWGQAGELVLRQVAANRAKKAALASQLASEGRSSKRSGTPAGSSSRARELSSAGGGGGRRGGRGGVSARSLSPSPRGDMAPAGADTVTQSSEELSQALKTVWAETDAAMDALSARLERIKSLKGESGLLDVKGQAIKMLVHLRAVFGQKGMAMYMCLYLNAIFVAVREFLDIFPPIQNFVKTYASFLIMPNEKNDDTSLALNVIEFGTTLVQLAVGATIFESVHRENGDKYEELQAFVQLQEKTAVKLREILPEELPENDGQDSSHELYKRLIAVEELVVRMREAESLSVFHEKKVKIPKGIYDPLTDIRVWFNPVAAYSRISWIFRDDPLLVSLDIDTTRHKIVDCLDKLREHSSTASGGD